MLFDFHTHLDMYDDLTDVVREITDGNILTIASSTDIASYGKTLEIAGASKLIIPTFGIHPSRAHLFKGNLKDFDNHITSSPLIGEIGLDYLWVEPLDEEAQKRIFCYIAGKAVEQDKYMVIHTKDAEGDILELLDELGAKKVIIHWYSGPMDVFKEYIERGWYFTFGIELCHSQYIRELAAAAPIDRILPETDNPVGVEWLDGRTGMPFDITKVYEQLLVIHGPGLMEYINETAHNILGNAIV